MGSTFPTETRLVGCSDRADHDDVAGGADDEFDDLEAPIHDLATDLVVEGWRPPIFHPPASRARLRAMARKLARLAHDPAAFHDVLNLTASRLTRADLDFLGEQTRAAVREGAAAGQGRDGATTLAIRNLVP